MYKIETTGTEFYVLRLHIHMLLKKKPAFPLNKVSQDNGNLNVTFHHVFSENVKVCTRNILYLQMTIF